MIRNLVSLGVLVVATPAAAVEVAIEVVNLAPSNGVALSPFFVGVHDGSFDPFDQDAAAGAGIEAVAELGAGASLMSEFAMSHPSGVSGIVTANSGAFGPGIFLPGGTGRITFELDPSVHRYLTYAAMVVPSNDYFIGNDGETAIELFDVAGNFTGSEVTVTADQIWNAGTEVDDPADGPAFISGQDAAVGTPEGGTVTSDSDLTRFGGASTPAGYTFSSIPTGNDAIARLSINVVPEPTGAVLAMLAATVAMLLSMRRAPA